jgi:hypothetical protein
MLQMYVSMFHLCFRTYVAVDVVYVSHIYCKFFICMLHLFYTYIASVLSECCIYLQWLIHIYFPRVLDVRCKCFNCFRRMLQMFHLNIIKVDLVLHILQLDPSAVTACYSCWTCLHARGCGGGTGDMRNRASVDQDATPAWARAGVGNEAARALA